MRERQPVEASDKIPTGNLILLDELGQRVLSLGGRGTRPLIASTDLQGLKVGPQGKLIPAGKYRLDPVRGELTTPVGDHLPVEVDTARATVRVLRGGTLTINSRPAGATVTVDGADAGAGSRPIPLAEGKHRVPITTRAGSVEHLVDILPGQNVGLGLAEH